MIMKSNVKKAIEEYEKLRLTFPRTGNFSFSDYQQIYDMSNGEMFKMIDIAMRFAFVKGVRYQKKKERRG